MAKANPLLEVLAQQALQAIAETNAVDGWLRTLAEVGRPPAPGQRADVPANTRVQAARAGLDLLTRLVGDVADTEAGQHLLAALGKMEETAEKLGEGAAEDRAEQASRRTRRSQRLTTATPEPRRSRLPKTGKSNSRNRKPRTKQRRN